MPITKNFWQPHSKEECRPLAPHTLFTQAIFFFSFFLPAEKEKTSSSKLDLINFYIL
jgi:hypothetical protein